MKTTIDIVDDVYARLKDTPLTDEARGELCKGQRPHGSTAEDIVVSCIANLPAQSQSATVYVNIYAAALVIDGQPTRDYPRMRELARAAMQTFEGIRVDDYRLTLDTQGDEFIEATKEYVITNKLLYQVINE